LKNCFVLIICLLYTATISGQQFDLRSIIFNDQIEKTPIDTIQIKGLSSRSALTTAADSLQKTFISRGFLNYTAATDTTTSNTTVYQELFLGKKYSTIRILMELINGSEELDASSLSRKRIRYTTPALLEKELTKIRAEWNDRGQPFAKIAIHQWEFAKTDTAKAIVRVEPESFRKINRIVVKGYPNYPKNQIDNLINTRTLYNSHNLEKIERRISTLQYLENIKAPEALFKRDSTLLYIYVNKKTANIADGLIGFNTNEEGKLEINGFIEATLQNNFNYGERIDFTYRNDNADQSRLGIQVDLPSIIRKRIGINSGLEILRRDSLYQNTTLNLGLNYQLPKNAWIQLNYNNRESTADSQPSIIGKENNNYSTNGIAAQFHLIENSVNRLQPENFNLSFMAGAQERTLESNADTQYILELRLEKLWSLSHRLNLLSRANTYLLKTKNLQFNELRQIGGVNSIRGFNQNSIDTAAYLLTQTELRYALNDQIFLNLLGDGGVFEEYLDRNPKYLYAYGAGFGILTNAGILRLEVASGSFSGANQGVSSTIAHLNLKVFF
jgi:outer membrane protein assembly factor BamA